MAQELWSEDWWLSCSCQPSSAGPTFKFLSWPSTPTVLGLKKATEPTCWVVIWHQGDARLDQILLIKTHPSLLPKGGEKGNFFHALRRQTFKAWFAEVTSHAELLSYLGALLINSELQDEEIKVLIICTKCLWYFSSLSNLSPPFLRNCLVKTSGSIKFCALSLKRADLTHTFPVTGPAATPSPVPWPWFPGTVPALLQISSLSSSRCLFFFPHCPAVLPVTPPMSLWVPAACQGSLVMRPETVTSFSCHNMEVIHKTLLEPG